MNKTITNEYGDGDHKKLTEAIDKAQQNVSSTFCLLHECLFDSFGRSTLEVMVEPKFKPSGASDKRLSSGSVALAS